MLFIFFSYFSMNLAIYHPVHATNPDLGGQIETDLDPKH